MTVVLLAVQAGQPEDPKWTDVAGFIATSAGVVVTLLAVLVALFGPGWQTKRRRPKVTLRVDPNSGPLPVPINISERYARDMRLLIENDPGQDTALDVEVFVTIVGDPGKDDSGFEYFEGVTEAEALVFDNPELGGPLRDTSTVPAGFSRPVWFALVGPIDTAFVGVGLRWSGPEDSEAVRLTKRDDLRACAIVTTADANRGPAPVLLLEHGYTVHLIVTGSNFDAQHYVGRVKGSYENGEMSDYVDYEWIQPPTRTTKPPDLSRSTLVP